MAEEPPGENPIGLAQVMIVGRFEIGNFIICNFVIETLRASFSITS
jgi:hypothetical protein